ncbi:MAG: DUF5662 family protein [Bacilli bacterium]|nr:DUF5662 family protein [Bacilli bacterium]
MNAFFRHFGLVNRHRFQVWRNGCRCGIGFHCLFHDLSKYGPKEFWPSVRYFAGDHSPVLEQRKNEEYFSTICQHHTRRNKHHWEYWTDFYMGRIIAKTMPYVYATEYVCDMLAASYCYDPKGFSGQKTLDYYMARNGHYFMSDATREYVTWCLTRFAELGFAGLKKADTKKAYAEICSRHSDVRIYGTSSQEGALPPLR